jgi:micrococcal nuclease
MNPLKVKILLQVFLALLLFTPALTHAQPQETATITKIVDGDTFWVKFQGKEQKVRLIGMDTPEISYNRKTKSDMAKTGRDLATICRQGREACDFVKTLIKKGEEVRLEFDVRKMEPKKGKQPARLLAYVYLADGRMLNEEIVKAGYGQVYTVPPNLRYVERFKRAEREARENRWGLWRD